jgi:antagonist of KipI
MSLRVLDPGLYTLVVDFGRPHARSLGVPVGGAADRTSLALGNALVGNPPDAAALEFSLTGPTLEARCELACVVYGAPFQLVSNRQRLTSGKTFTLRPGEVLQVLGTPTGMRGYLCVRGGLQTPIVLGSRSSLGPLQAGDELPCLPGTIGAHFFRWMVRRADGSHEERGGLPGACQRFLMVPGPQADWFPAEASFFSTTEASPLFEVTAASNRMGLRLKGPPLPFPDRELLSEPVCPGAVQVTRDGQCIILGVDGQTIGGYPKVAQVISADFDTLGQVRPGTKCSFVPTTLKHAERLYRENQAELRAWVTRLRAAAGDW